IALLIAFGSPQPQATEWQHVGNQIKATLVATRSHFTKHAYHFLRTAAAIFSIIHRSPPQISHNAIRNPMTSSRKPMSFQKDLPRLEYMMALAQSLRGTPRLAYGNPLASNLRRRKTSANV